MPVLALQRPTKASKWGLDGAHTERPVEKLPSIFERGAKTFRMPETYERRGAREAPWRERSTRLAASRAADGFPQKSFAGEESDVDDMIQLEIRFVNRDLNLQLLLPFEFELTWVPR